MGLYNKSYKSYDKNNNKYGDAVFTPPVSQRTIDSVTAANVAKARSELKSQLESVNNDIKYSMKSAGSMNRSVDTNDAAKARSYDMKQMVNARNSIINQLRRLGVDVIRQSLDGSNIQYKNDRFFQSTCGSYLHWRQLFQSNQRKKQYRLQHQKRYLF